MSLDRRRFLRMAGGVALLGATGGLGFVRLGPAAQTGTLLRSRRPMPGPFTVPLPIPPEARPLPGGPEGTDRYEVTQRQVAAQILPGVTTPVWGYDGSFPGPTFRARRGRPVEVTFRNELPVPTAVHLHGGHTPAESDGYPTDLIPPRGTEGRGAHGGHAMGGDTTVGERRYVYPLGQRAATLWYHDHAMDFTGPHVYRGLAGFFLVGDDEDDALGLPAGERDLPLMICDRAFDEDGAMLYPALAPDESRHGVEERYMGGVLGDVVLVNGAPWPVHEVARTRYRLRFLNASNARRYRLALGPPPPEGTAFAQVGTDGGLLETPLARDTVTLASAERADVVVDFGAYPVGTQVTLVNELGGGRMGEVMRFDVVRDGPDDSRVPDRLSVIEPLRRDDAVTTRTFAFQLSPADTAGGPGGGEAGVGGAGDRVWTISGRAFDPAHDHARPRRGDVEVRRFMTNVHHPIHVHLDPFQVLARNGDDPRPGDGGWKDTIDLIPGETAEVAIRFTDYAGRFVFHCHNLEHEDMAMMANFTVT